MDDTPAKNPPGESINKIDLSAFEAFEFGTQWTDAGKDKNADRGEPRRGERPRSPGRDSGSARKDRRPPRRPGDGPASGFPGGTGGGEDRQSRPQRDRRSMDRGGPHRGPRQERSDHFERGPRGHGGPPRPYQSPVFDLTFYPDDHGFTALVKAMRASCRTYELFEIARLILGKPERCVVVFTRRKDSAESGPLFVAVPDGVPFPTEDEAVNHALEHHLDQFFTIEEIEAEPPKGSFQFVNRCPVTKALLGPPNYHRYSQIVQQHYATHNIRMAFEDYKASIEVVRDEEAVKAWLESMKKGTRYTYLGSVEGESGVFDNLEDARAFLLRTCRDRIVRAVESARVAAKNVEAVPHSEAARAMNGAVEMQRRFPLDAANALRGRLRRENFHIFKRGAKGVTYVCGVRRKFRQPGQVFSESINRLIDFLDANPMCPISELPLRHLGIQMPQEISGVAAVSVPGEGGEASAPAETPPTLTPEQNASLNRLLLDLRWLVTEGYVAEYSDGRLVAHPVMAPEVPKPKPKPPKPETQPESAVPAESESSAEVAADVPPTETAAEPTAATDSPGEEPPTPAGKEPSPESAPPAEPRAEEVSQESESASGEPSPEPEKKVSVVDSSVSEASAAPADPEGEPGGEAKS